MQEPSRELKHIRPQLFRTSWLRGSSFVYYCNLLIIVLVIGWYIRARQGSLNTIWYDPEISWELLVLLFGLQLNLLGLFGPGLVLNKLYKQRRSERLPRLKLLSICCLHGLRRLLPLVVLPMPILAVLGLSSRTRFQDMVQAYGVVLMVLWFLSVVMAAVYSRTGSKRRGMWYGYGTVGLLYIGTGAAASIGYAGEAEGWFKLMVMGMSPMGAMLDVWNPTLTMDTFGGSAPLRIWYSFMFIWGLAGTLQIFMIMKCRSSWKWMAE